MITESARIHCTEPMAGARLRCRHDADPTAATPMIIGGVTLVAGAFVAGLNHCFS